MNVEIIKGYNDTELGRYVSIGEILAVSRERATALIDAGVAEEMQPDTPVIKNTYIKPERKSKSWGVTDGND